jgi:hypothetical protein
VDVGIVGRPASGRTTVFRALLAHRAPRTERSAQGGAVGTIHVQDPRLDALSARFRPRKTTPVEIRVHDLCPSLEPSFPTAELESMRRADVLLLVTPSFDAPDRAAAAAAFARLLGELCFEDLAAVERRLERHPRDRLADLELRALELARDALEAETPLRALELGDPERQALRGYNLITDRPQVVLENLAESAAGEPPHESLVEAASARGIPCLALAAALEAEMADLPLAERAAYLAEYGVREPAGAAVTRAVLGAADLIPFFTVGEDECRAWAIERGTPAGQAAGKVHSDIERGFIRAEVIACEDLLALPGLLHEARKAGKLRLEGKEYLVQDGEVVRFRFNV